MTCNDSAARSRSGSVASSGTAPNARVDRGQDGQRSVALQRVVELVDHRGQRRQLGSGGDQRGHRFIGSAGDGGAARPARRHRRAAWRPPVADGTLVEAGAAPSADALVVAVSPRRRRRCRRRARGPASRGGRPCSSRPKCYLRVPYVRGAMESAVVPPVTGAADLTAGWCSAALAGCGGTVVGVRAEPIGTGQVADTVRLYLEWDPAGAGPATLIAKVPAAEESSRTGARLTRTYEIEASFYRDLGRRPADPHARRAITPPTTPAPIPTSSCWRTSRRPSRATRCAASRWRTSPTPSTSWRSSTARVGVTRRCGTSRGSTAPSPSTWTCSSGSSRTPSSPSASSSPTALRPRRSPSSTS